MSDGSMFSQETLGDAMLWFMVPSITSIMVVVAIVLHHVRKQDVQICKSRYGSNGEMMSSMDRFGYGLTLQDISNPSSSIDFNTKTPIPINTSLFQGQAYVLLRNPHGDSFWDPYFQGKQRMIWVMVQGTFKREPKGTLYVAGELPEPMNLTFWTKACVSMMIASAKSLMGRMHFSFGDEKECPHLALPLYQSADTLIATPMDEVPPKFGAIQLSETPEARVARKRTPPGTESFRTDMVYSFQFHTMHVDLAAWSIVNLPGIQDVSLKSFLGDKSLRLGVYEHNGTTSDAHINKEYCFLFDIASSVPEPPPMDKIELPGAEFDMWMWLEHFDSSTELRPVTYLVRVLQPNGTPSTLMIPSTSIAAVLAVDTPLDAISMLTRARQDNYQAIEDQLTNLNRRLHSIAAEGSCEAKKELVRCLSDTSNVHLIDELSAKMLGVRLWRWDMNICREGSGYRIVSDSFIRQEYVVLTSTELLMYRTYSSTPAKRVPVNHITEVSIRSINDMSVVSVHTWTEVVHLHVPQPDAWKEAIEAASERSTMLSAGSKASSLNLATWTPFNIVTYEGQLVLNSRKIYADSMNESLSPIAVAERCVLTAVHAATSREHRMEFQHATQALRLVDLTLLESSDAKLVFLLNIYQALLVHVSLVLPNMSTTSMHQCAFEVGTQKLVLSLAEMEHVLLRAASPSLSSVPYLDFVPEATAYPTSFSILALPYRDFRISCALHAHRTDKRLVSYSMDQVHEQLSDVVGIYMRQHVRVNRKIVYLPLVCKWYQVDFGHQILRKTMGFLTESTISQIQEVIDDPKFLLEFKDGAVRPSPHWSVGFPNVA